MGDIQFSRGYVNEEAAQAGRFGQRVPAPNAQGPETKAPNHTAAASDQSDGEFGFDDFLDIINPLQHIPIVSTLYRELTGDEISAPARIFGGTLFGGPTGFVSAIANTFFDEVAGEDIGTSVLAFFDGGEGENDPQLATPNGDLAGNAFSAAPLVTAANRPTADPTGPDAEARATETVVPAGLLPITTPPVMPPAGVLPAGVLPAGVLPATEQPPTPVPAAVTGHAQQSSHLKSRDNSSGNGGVLTGQAALSALFNDLRGGAAPAPSPSMPAPTGSSREAQPARQLSDNSQTTSDQTSSQILTDQVDSGTDAATAPNPAVADAAQDAALANQMLMALDKYQAMTRQRGLANPPPPTPDQPERL